MKPKPSSIAHMCRRLPSYTERVEDKDAERARIHAALSVYHGPIDIGPTVCVGTSIRDSWIAPTGESRRKPRGAT